jgi:flagellar biosynthetic protein FlhB
MAEESSSSQERTEKPTPRRREQARSEGRVPRSHEISTAAVMLAGTMALAIVGAPRLAEFSTRVLRESARGLASGPMSEATAVGMLRYGVVGLMMALLPFLLGLAGIVLLVNLIQARGVVSWTPLTPKLSNLNPVAGLKRILGLDAVVTLLKSVAKLAALGMVTFLVLSHAWPDLSALAQTGPGATSEVMRSLVMRLALMTGITFLAVALLDYGYQIYKTEKGLRMTRQEVVREYHETEGNPLVKARIHSLMRARARTRMLQAVPTADVVIVNPTEIAIALKYDLAVAPAPVVVAMGQRKLAERIKALALKAGVPVLENRPVARALIATASVGQPIPPALYAVVAEILAFVYRQRAVLPKGLRPEADRRSA